MASSDEPRGGPPAAVEDNASSVSRRSFLKSVGVTGVVAGVVAEATPTAQAPAPAAIGPGEVSVALTVNGTKRSLKVEPRVTLLDALRNRLDVTGLKRVCDRGTCGACTAIVDGRTAYTCSMLAIEAQGKEIRTIEGLSDGTVLHPVQQAILDHDGTMCGFCTPGFVMAAVGLLEKNPKPTAEQAREALDGNICRCGTYNRLLDAVLQVKGGSRG